MLNYKRILLKLSGEALQGENKHGIDEKRLEEYAVQIKEIQDIGVEVGIMTRSNGLSAFANYTLTKVESLADEKKGLQLKGIPENIFSFGFSYLFDFGLNAALGANSSSDGYLDDDNQNMIPDYVIWDAKLEYNYGSIGCKISVNNLFNKKYYTMGYLLDNINYFYPMSQRNILIDITAQF